MKKEIILEKTKENIEFYNKETLTKLLKGKIKVKIAILRESSNKYENSMLGGGNEEITIPYRIFYTGMENIKKIFEVNDESKNKSLFSTSSEMKMPTLFNNKTSPFPPPPPPPEPIEKNVKEEPPNETSPPVPPVPPPPEPIENNVQEEPPNETSPLPIADESTTHKIKITIFGEEENLKNDYKEILEEWKWIKTAIKMKRYIANYEKYKINKKIILIGEVKEWDDDHNENTIKEEFKEKNRIYLDKYENTELFKELMN